MATLPERRLGPSLSVADGAPVFSIGELVIVRIPVPIQVDELVEDEATDVSDLPPTSNGSSPQHAAFVRQVSVHSDTSYLLEVYAVLSFTASGGALAGYNLMTDAAKATLLPLPFLSHRHPTPEAFGAPLDFGNWSTRRDSWLSIIPRRFVMPASRPFKRMNPPLIMPLPVLNRINIYRQNLLPNHTTNAEHHDDRSDLPYDGNGDGQRRGGQGDRGGNSTFGVTSVTSSPTIIGDGGGEKAGGGVEQFSVNTSHGYLVLEGVDEDAEGPDATMLDELLMMARDDPMWREELRRHLQEKERERAQTQKERAVRLACWRKDMAIQPT